MIGREESDRNSQTSQTIQRSNTDVGIDDEHLTRRGFEEFSNLRFCAERIPAGNVTSLGAADVSSSALVALTSGVML